MKENFLNLDFLNGVFLRGSEVLMMKRNFRNNNAPKPKCLDCESAEVKKRKNLSHGSGSKARCSYVCKKCGSSRVAVGGNRNNFRR